MIYSALNDLYHEYGQEIYSLHTLYLDSIVGYSLIQQATVDYQSMLQGFLDRVELAQSDFTSDCTISYSQICGEEHHPMSPKPNMKISEVKARTTISGYNNTHIGILCLIRAYAFWNESFRPRVRDVVGLILATNTDNPRIASEFDHLINVDIWGDIREIRNMYVHNKGIADNNIRKCKIINWLLPDDILTFDNKQMQFIFFNMAKYGLDLFKMSLPPGRTLRVPHSRPS